MLRLPLETDLENALVHTGAASRYICQKIRLDSRKLKVKVSVSERINSEPTQWDEKNVRLTFQTEMQNGTHAVPLEKCIQGSTRHLEDNVD